ncbi:MAG: 2,3-bisphosphoglycerate-independent phosphoglycerate mutase, partial [Fidelibacterota bacterium]
DSGEANAFRLSKTPAFDELFTRYPWSRLDASGEAVGLPPGVIGNSEVGHMTISAGRIIKQDLVRINGAIEDGSFTRIPELQNVMAHVRKKASTLHLLGLISDGGVHSHIDHLIALLRLAKTEGVGSVCLHAVTDGRDTPPAAGIQYVRRTTRVMEEVGVGTISTVVGRYYAMDRDKRWDRTERAYRAFVAGECQQFPDPESAVQSSYDENVTDEFVMPRAIPDGEGRLYRIEENDALLCFNFRADRMRQITRALGGKTFGEFPRLMEPVLTTTMTSYEDSFAFPVVFKPISLDHILPQILEEQGYRQLRLAETEKYAHVTYFFNGGDETAFPREDRILVPSPKVSTYDQQPEMSAPGVKQRAIDAIVSGEYDCIIMNIANPDMVGHTGNLQAAIDATEVADSVVGEVVAATGEAGAVAFVTSDHGNVEIMMDTETGEIHTAHSLNPVPFIVIDSGDSPTLQKRGGLTDVAPTILDFLGIPVPDAMTGRSLLGKS